MDPYLSCRNDHTLDSNLPRKRRKLGEEPRGVNESQWGAFAREVEAFNVQHVHGKGKFAFAFIQGPLVQALKKGHW